jgi:hypothetical protein
LWRQAVDGVGAFGGAIPVFGAGARVWRDAREDREVGSDNPRGVHPHGYFTPQTPQRTRVRRASLGS